VICFADNRAEHRSWVMTTALSKRLERERNARAVLEASHVFSRILAAQGVEDERLKQLVLDAAVKDIAVTYANPNLDPNELGRVLNGRDGTGRDGAIAKAREEQERLEREESLQQAKPVEPSQQPDDQMTGHATAVVRSRAGREDYADLAETHERVKAEQQWQAPMLFDPAIEESMQQAGLEQQRDESAARQLGEMEGANLGATTRADIEQGVGEQSDSKRETDDRALQRLARMRAFGREIEESMQQAGLEQDGGREL
jgi:hypothetical protein